MRLRFYLLLDNISACGQMNLVLGDSSRVGAAWAFESLLRGATVVLLTK